MYESLNRLPKLEPGEDDFITKPEFLEKKEYLLYWLLHPKINITLEWLSEFRDDYVWDDDWGGEIKKNYSIHWINPGVRFAFHAGPVEFVPGFCVPLQVHGKKKPKTAYLSVSMEHPF